MCVLNNFQLILGRLKKWRQILDTNSIRGAWIDGISGALLIIAWQRDVSTQTTRVETYILVPPSGLLNDSPGATNLQAGVDPKAIRSDLVIIAESRVQSKLSDMISSKLHERYPDLFPYTFTEIARGKLPITKLLSELMICYENATEKMRSDLNGMEDQTSCEALRDCLRMLREGNPWNLVTPYIIVKGRLYW